MARASEIPLRRFTAVGVQLTPVVAPANCGDRAFPCRHACLREELATPRKVGGTSSLNPCPRVVNPSPPETIPRPLASITRYPPACVHGRPSRLPVVGAGSPIGGSHRERNGERHDLQHLEARVHLAPGRRRPLRRQRRPPEGAHPHRRAPCSPCRTPPHPRPTRRPQADVPTVTGRPQVSTHRLIPSRSAVRPSGPH